MSSKYNIEVKCCSRIRLSCVIKCCSSNPCNQIKVWHFTLRVRIKCCSEMIKSRKKWNLESYKSKVLSRGTPRHLGTPLESTSFFLFFCSDASTKIEWPLRTSGVTQLPFTHTEQYTTIIHHGSYSEWETFNDNVNT